MGDVERAGWTWHWVSVITAEKGSAVMVITIRRVLPLLPLEQFAGLESVTQASTNATLDVIPKTNNINGVRDDFYKTVVNGIRDVGAHVGARYD